jgi:hypothetical protein
MRLVNGLVLHTVALNRIIGFTITSVVFYLPAREIEIFSNELWTSSEQPESHRS